MQRPSIPSQPPQLPLDLRLSPTNRWENFVVGDNQPVVHALQQLHEPLTIITGKCGKTHLLQAHCFQANTDKKRSVYLPLDLPSLHPDMLHGVEQYDVVAFDNLECVLGKAEWERGLYDCLNRCRSTGAEVVIALQQRLNLTPMQLSDLRSRLQWGPEYHLTPLNDDNLLRALTLQANSRGMQLATETAQYLLTRASRDLHELMLLLEKLDMAQLAEKRQLTIPFVKQLLVGA